MGKALTVKVEIWRMGFDVSVIASQVALESTADDLQCRRRSVTEGQGLDSVGSC